MPAYPKISSRPLLALLACASASHVSAQSVAPAAAPVADENVVVLSAFEISAEQASRYQADQVASGGRIATDIMDTPANVTVLTRDFLEDVGGLKVLDAAKYVAGVSAATIPNGLDRVNIRGFQSDGRRVDGFSTADQANYDTAGIERMEIFKGPDALLQPSGVPGGTINLVTKKPQFTAGGYITVSAGEFDANRVEADVTGPLGDSDRFAYRMVAAVQDSEGYIDGSFRESLFLAPSFTWRLTPSTQLTIQYEHYDFKTANLEGIPVDPSVGTNDDFKLLEGLREDFSPALGEDYAFRKVKSDSVSFFLTSAINENLSVRLAGRAAEIDTPDSGFSWGPSTQGGSRNPQTGLWEGGVIYSSTAPYAGTAAPALSTTYSHTGTYQEQRLRYRDLQNDWAYTYDTPFVTTSTGAGVAYTYEHQNLVASRQTAQNFDIANFTADTSAPTVAAPNTDRRRTLSLTQFYLTEKLGFLDDRLFLTGGLTHATFSGVYGNKLSAATSTAVAGQMYAGDGSKATVNYGVVVRPIKPVSVYYGHSENAVPSTNFQQVAQGSAPKFAEGTQDEVGVKVQLFEDRVSLAVAYYEISQTGYSLANPANLSSPPPAVLLPAIITDREASGWEFQVNAALTRNLSMVAAYADTKNRDPYDNPFRGAAEEEASLYLRYEFDAGALDGFAIGAGTSYLGKRAGDNAPSGYTAASTDTNPITNKPSFYLPAQTITDVNLSYTRGSWIYRLNVNNVFDAENYDASQTRFLVYVGNPRNVSGSVTFKF